MAFARIFSFLLIGVLLSVANGHFDQGQAGQQGPTHIITQANGVIIDIIQQNIIQQGSSEHSEHRRRRSTTTVAGTPPTRRPYHTGTRPSRPATTRTTPTAESTTTSVVAGTPPTPNEFCMNCMGRQNQKAYYANPADCHSYFQCFFFETFATGILRSCPPATFWNDAVLTCVPEGPVPCVDLCLDETVAAAGCHSSPTSCAEFFTCSAGSSTQFCCPPTTSFDQATCSCISNPDCTDICAPVVLLQTTVAPSILVNETFCIDSFNVSHSTVPGRPDQFESFDFSNPEGPETFTMTCASGTLFNVESCRCDIINVMPASNPGRQCSLWLPFDQNLEDQSALRLTTFFYGNGGLDNTVSYDGAGSLFVDGGRLEIPGLQTTDFQRAATFCFFFRCENGPTNNPYSCVNSAGILSNNNNASQSEYTVIMATEPSNMFTGDVRFRNPTSTASVSSTINTSANGWNQACITYDGTNVTLYLNGAVAATSPGAGSLAIGHCPYVVGTDQTFGDFMGHIDDVLICPFVLDPSEIAAFSQGDFGFLALEGLIPASR